MFKKLSWLIHSKKLKQIAEYMYEFKQKMKLWDLMTVFIECGTE